MKTRRDYEGENGIIIHNVKREWDKPPLCLADYWIDNLILTTRRRSVQVWVFPWPITPPGQAVLVLVSGFEAILLPSSYRSSISRISTMMATRRMRLVCPYCITYIISL